MVPRSHQDYEGATTPIGVSAVTYLFRFRRPRDPPVFVFAIALLGGGRLRQARDIGMPVSRSTGSFTPSAPSTPPILQPSRSAAKSGRLKIVDHHLIIENYTIMQLDCGHAKCGVIYRAIPSIRLRVLNKRSILVRLIPHVVREFENLRGNRFLKERMIDSMIKKIALIFVSFLVAFAAWVFLTPGPANNPTPRFLDAPCEPSIAEIKERLKKSLADGTIDQPVLDKLNPSMTLAEQACTAGDRRRANATLFNVVMAASLGSDHAYARKVQTQNTKENLEPGRDSAK